MFYLNVWQNEIILAMLGAGVILTLGMALLYMELWRPRTETSEEPAEGARREPLAVWFLSHVSWLLMVIAAGAAIWGLLYAIDKIAHPPNW